MNKKKVRNIVIIILFLLSFIGILVYFFVPTYPFEDIDSKKIEKISIGGGALGVYEMTDADEINKMVELLKPLKGRRKINIGSIKGSYYGLDIYYEDGKMFTIVDTGQIFVCTGGRYLFKSDLPEKIRDYVKELVDEN